MKIALVDNMNNNFFALARYLRDEGMDAHLFCMPGGHPHFHPQADTIRDVSKLSWVHWLPYDLNLRKFFLRTHRLLRMFTEFDLRIVCGFVPAFFNYCNIPVDVFIPYGSDLYSVPFLPTNGSGIIRRLAYRRFSAYQRLGIQSSRAVIIETQHPLYRQAAGKLDIDPINLGLPMVYNREDYAKLDEAWRFLDDHDLVLFNHCRHIWSSNPDELPDFSEHGGNKRNDKIIRAFARFLKVTGFTRPLLVTFEFGPDVAQSKELIEHLGIGKNVRWMPQSARVTIMAGLRRASLCSDMFRQGLCGLGGTGYEALASGVPLMTHTNGALTNPEHPFCNAPIIDVLEEDEILATLMDYEKNPDKYRSMGAESKIWFEEHLGGGLAKKYLKMLEYLSSHPAKRVLGTGLQSWQ